MVKNNSICFEVETEYKSGRKMTEVIASKNEKSMWEIYDQHHNTKLIESSKIVDSWLS